MHDTAHRMGIPTHCTLLYGHVETYEERVDHLLRLRAQQDATGGFLAFIPLAFHPENTVFERRGFKFTTGRRRPEDDRGVAPAARQHPEHQGVLDHDGHADGAARAALRRERRAGHGRAREDLPGGGRDERHRAEDRRSSCASSRTRAASRCSATRSTTSCADGESAAAIVMHAESGRPAASMLGRLHLSSTGTQDGDAAERRSTVRSAWRSSRTRDERIVGGAIRIWTDRDPVPRARVTGAQLAMGSSGRVEDYPERP